MSVSKYALKIDYGLQCIDQLTLLSDICTLFPWFGTGDDGPGCDEFGEVLFAYTPVGVHHNRFTFVLAHIKYDMPRYIKQ